MGKQSGLGDNLYVSGYDVSGDVGQVGNIAGPLATLDVTGIDKEANERIGGLRDGAIEFTAFWNPERATDNPGVTRDRAHAVLSSLPTADRHVMYCRGTQLGSQAACLVSKQINYDPSRGDDGSFTLAVSAQANGFGLEWCTQLTPGKRTDTAATNGPAVDLVAPTAFGLQAYLQVFAFTGTSATIKLQESSDNGAADAWTDVVDGSFAAVAGITEQRIQTARDQTVERYLRVVTAGTFTQLVFAVGVAKNDVEVSF
ncbi:hypothetical protein [Amycolatopsis thermoflava]|uniref:hypothetical protein n=1 Tax=Amycolatopsis thermoflava TaxID=84480 RepID=UPI0003FDC18B|nr:hypothetical protein [Amycolatopsis thermoflava]